MTLRQPEDECGFNGAEHYGVALATRPPLGPLRGGRYVPYASSQMGRGLLLGRAAWPGVGTVALGSTHLESWVGEHMQVAVKEARRAQLAQAGRLLVEEATREGCGVAVLLGDMNWKDKQDGDALAAIGAGWSDAWVVAGQPKDGARTCWYDRLDRVFFWQRSAAPQNPFALAGGRPNGEGASVRGGRVAVVGREPIPGETYEYTAKSSGKTSVKPLTPSDHVGVLVELRRAS